MAKGITKSTSDAGKTPYITEFVHDLDADRVQPTITARKKKYGARYVDHTIIPETDGQFTILFIYLAA